MWLTNASAYILVAAFAKVVGGTSLLMVIEKGEEGKPLEERAWWGIMI